MLYINYENNMDEYTIYCTEEQTKKAFELGAPINTIGCTRGEIPLLDGYVELVVMDDNTSIIGEIPTAEQMLGWLRLEKGFMFRIMDFTHRTDWSVTKDLFFRNGYSTISPTEATLKAIDVALEYLTNKAMEDRQ